MKISQAIIVDRDWILNEINLLQEVLDSKNTAINKEIAIAKITAFKSVFHHSQKLEPVIRGAYFFKGINNDGFDDYVNETEI